MPVNGDVAYPIAYQPAVVTGSTGLTDGSSNPLPGQAFFFIAHDIGAGSQIFPDSPCGPSIGSNCLSNSNVRTQPPWWCRTIRARPRSRR